MVRARPLLPSVGVGTPPELTRPRPSRCGGLVLAGELKCSGLQGLPQAHAADRAELGLELGWATLLLL